MTKAYEKDKCFPETENVRCIPFNQTSPTPNTAVNDSKKIFESTSNKNCHSREQTLNIQTSYRKTDKIQKKLGSATNETSRKKIQPKIINLSK